MKCSLSFIELPVRDLSVGVAWYQEVLGLELLLRDGERFALLAAGTTRLALKVGEPGDSAIQLAFEVADLDAWLIHLQKHGITLDGPVKDSPEGYRRARLRDPNGYAVALFAWSGERPAGSSLADNASSTGQM